MPEAAGHTEALLLSRYDLRRLDRLGVVADQVIPQPQIGLGLVLRRVEVIERLVRFLDRSERPLDPRVKPEGRLLPFDRAVTRRPSESRGMCVCTSTPSCAITRRKVADFATGPLSR